MDDPMVLSLFQVDSFRTNISTFGRLGQIMMHTCCPAHSGDVWIWTVLSLKVL